MLYNCYLYHGNWILLVEGQFDTGTTTTDTATTSMETDGSNANINNVTDGDTYNDNAVHSSK